MPGGVTEKWHRLLLTADAVGGVWTWALDLAAAAIARGFRVRLLVLGPSPSPEMRRQAARVAGLELVETGLPLEWTAATPEEVIEASRHLASMVEAHEPDLVHLSNPALAAAGPWSVPLVATLHSCVGTWWAAVHPGQPMPDDLRWRQALVGRGLASADIVTVPTLGFAQAASELYPDIVFEVVQNGRRAGGEAPTGRPRVRVLAAGRLWDGAKNMATLDAAAARLAVPVEAAGPVMGPNGARIELPHLRLLGELGADAMRQKLARTAVYVSPARFEPFGLGVLEAAQGGAALLLSDIPVHRELWDDAAQFFEAEDAVSLAGAIAALMDDPARTERLAAAALSRAQAFGVDRMAAGMIALYERLLGHSPALCGAA